MALPISRSQVEQLGTRLVAGPRPAPEDLATLRQVLDVYGLALESAVNRTRETLGVAPTSRVKSLGTTLDKLRRNGGSGLKSMQDLAGMRIVKEFDRSEQDELVGRLVSLFGQEAREPKVIDRRIEPSHGYRAVHVVVFPDEIPVEIQVRTMLQHEWANLFEKLADRVGRGIRYGEQPTHWLSPEERRRLGVDSAHRYEMEYRERCRVVDLAKEFAERTAELERTEATIPLASELLERRAAAAAVLRSFRGEIDEMLFISSRRHGREVPLDP